MDASGISLALRQAYVQAARLAGPYSIEAMSARDGKVFPRSPLPLAFLLVGATPEAQNCGSEQQMFGEEYESPRLTSS
jgi:hypothetical protein